MSVRSVDLNSDMGEGFGVYEIGDDRAMLGIVTSANIACGFHAGDPLVMHKTMALARDKGVDIGAHPGFLDLWGFGRRPIFGDSPADIEKMLIYQLGAAQAMAASLGARVTHIKTHGSLGNMAARDADLSQAIVRATLAVDRDLIFVTAPFNETDTAARRANLRVASEIFADRAYDDTGYLMARKLPGAVLHDASFAAERLARMIDAGAIISESGRKFPTAIDTICVHGDNPAAVAMAGKVRETLAQLGFDIVPMSKLGRF
ncbi:5-oxoprolinase subunit PxpA [Telmatospirillum sp.]|uniref:LamB/YcsF family protein n=1 Tax=Telmatospirillum sp. TaxID=2079197 RepID=UPI00284C49C5|nr:5-oxoprolinase subunit PxpA [Telmatospirillum sp.]MDR3439834.1 5-oxoprolinase subunit PxpA [Telmatospirillum sp.]